MWDVFSISVHGVQRTVQGIKVVPWSVGTILLTWIGWTWMEGCGAIHTESGEAKCEIAMYRLRT
ncbi:MAG: hypothetical protein AEth_01535 [Candidatus Argoarchaeum ethanivorans]|uniref:Uncharacterized protein n=1 Tax=Candidatus Argoarchaeum ethanivorans TaxID=2608793 RepID=A0A8B3S1Q5_9EURY|nr:MAG: hypothetical protein AEth_01535 [Candidatus Argoarchaeum ethanivorans]